MVIDASVWVSSFVPGEVYHVMSRRWLAQRTEEGAVLVVPTLVLSEVAGAIARRTGVPSEGHRAAERVARTPGLRLVPLQAELGNSAARLAAECRLRGADAVYAAVALELALPLYTWDTEIQERAARVIRILRPADEVG